MNSPEPHCSSYYAASRNDNTEYATLQTDISCDVCVVGAGFTGISAALSLAERGYTVIVLEQHRVGWGATGRCGGQMIGGIPGEDRLRAHWDDSRARTLFDIGYRGHQLIEDRVQRYAIECSLKSGYVDVALRSSHLDQQQSWYETHCAHGMGEHVELLSKSALERMLGTDVYLGGMLNRRSGHLHPLNLCLGETRAAVGLGVTVYENSKVMGIQHGVTPVVTTPYGCVRADSVLLAGNAYQHLECASLCGLVFPAPSCIVATEPLAEQDVAVINPQDVAVCDQNQVPDYFRLSADRRLLFGGRCNYSGREFSGIEAVMRSRLRKIYPQLEHKRMDYVWSGKVGIALNRVPLLGRIGGNVYYALGYSGHGVSLSHTCGEIMADAVAGTLERFDLFAEVPRRRLRLGRRAGGSVLALGMLLQRLRDAI
ncbi:MAG: FAD-binding oxidoreductase [Halioglobus sp.]|nr:FAD-binding oxidoreductase [Halioglobus sp.]